MTTEDSHLTPPAADLEWAREIERTVTDAERPKYLEWLNNKPFSERKTPRDMRDGCILTGCFVRYVRDTKNNLSV